jgi:hypothetical protein
MAGNSAAGRQARQAKAGHGPLQYLSFGRIELCVRSVLLVPPELHAAVTARPLKIPSVMTLKTLTDVRERAEHSARRNRQPSGQVVQLKLGRMPERYS